MWVFAAGICGGVRQQDKACKFGGTLLFLCHPV